MVFLVMRKSALGLRPVRVGKGERIVTHHITSSKLCDAQVAVKRFT